MTAADALLATLRHDLEGREDLVLELSTRLGPRRVERRGRLCCWVVGGEPTDFTPLARALDRLGAPEAAREAQRRATLPRRQGIAVAASGDEPEFRLYLHDRDPVTLAERYEAWRWRPGAGARRSRYTFHFLPETPDGLRPLDLVSPELREGIALLLAEDRLARCSGFWLRRGEHGELEQVDLAFPWSPPAASLPGLVALARALDVQEDPAWRRLPVRHVAVPVGAAAPSVTLYTSAPRRGPWPADEDALGRATIREARRLNQRAENQIFARLPPHLASVDDRLDRFYGGDIATWRRVLGEDLHYHFGLFEAPDLDADDAAMDAALRRAVTELYPYIPAGGSVYDIGCGWGGPLAMWIRDLRCPSLGLTISAGQFRHVASLGLPVRWGDVERTLPPGRFDCAVLLESLSHVRDKPRLLRALRPFVGRLLMRVHCQDHAPPTSNFGGTMHMVSSAQLRELLTSNGWRIRHWRDRRAESMPSVAVWNRRLAGEPEGDDVHLETLRRWCRRVLRAPRAWATHNPLIEVVADRDDGRAETRRP